MFQKWLHILCCTFTIFYVKAESIDVRLNPSFFDASHKMLYVDIELKYNGQGIWVLADQNYRLYFDASNLKFVRDKYRPDLPYDLYSELQFVEIVDKADASSVGGLRFDNELGFLNFNVDLLDDQSGGLRITPKDGWVKVLTLKFKISKPENLNEIIWSTRGRTDKYATAFVEIMEWKAPMLIKPADINRFVDASFEQKKTKETDIIIGPNPTTDMVIITWMEPLRGGHDISVTDMSGMEVINVSARSGISDMRVNVAGLAAGAYQITISKDKQRVHRERIIKVQ